MVINQKEVEKLFIGNSTISKIYFGSLLVWQNKIKLDTPTNVSISGNTISFDEVENAGSYSIYAGNTLVGEYVPDEYLYSIDNGEVTLYNTNYDNISLVSGVMTLL